MDRTLALVLRNKKLLTALGTSSAVLSSGFVAWKSWRASHSQHQVELPASIVDGIGSDHDDIALSPAETKEELRCLIPRQLRKPWRLLHQANSGQYEQHLKAVTELSRLSLSDGEVVQLAQATGRRTAVGLARCGADPRWFLRVPLPATVTTGEAADTDTELESDTTTGTWCLLLAMTRTASRRW